MSHELADITTCLHCGQKFSSPRVTIIGQPTARLEQYLEALAKHLQEKHPQRGMIMAQHGAAFMELVFLRNFKTTDPELSEQQDRVRWQIHQQTLKARYPDENVKEQALGLSSILLNAIRWTDDDHIDVDQTGALFAARLTEAFTSIRDALEEPGKYSDPNPASSTVLV